MKQAPLLDVNPSARRADDFYATPAWMTRALRRRLPDVAISKYWRIAEPCAGDGAIVRELEAPSYPVLTNDLVPRGAFRPDFLLDARRRESWEAFAQRGAIDVVITNPPFDVAFAVAQQAVAAARIGVALLLRLSWLEPTDERQDWLAAHPPTGLIVMPRHDWRGNGSTDSVTSGWFVWDKSGGLFTASSGIEVVTKAERDALLADARQVP